ncbi:MAG: S41 family peptidase, partial [Planctomycetales bacterium]|nr:S41 family peptidase [Planctomycetales bacterium]
ASLVSGLAPLSAQSQVLIPQAALPAVAGDEALETLMAAGQRLEGERRWAEALSHYEDALRERPDDARLKASVDRTRVHYDLGRRYADSTFVALLGRVGLPDALALYDELLDKINQHYVTTPDWRGIVARGTFALDGALSDEIFVARHLPQATAEQIQAFRTELHQHMAWRPVRNLNEANDAVHVAARLANSRLGVSPTAVVMEYASGAITGLDNYSSYLTEAQLDDVFSQIEGNFVGLGIELKAEEGVLKIVAVIEGSPADRAGIVEGDRITAVDGRTTIEVSTDKAADMLKGEEGSTVDVTVVSGEAPPRLVRVRRERVEVPSVDQVKIADPQFGIGYLRINSFQKTTVRDLDAALWSLHRQGMRSLIIDVRGNPGGLLTASVEAADRFVSDGNIVSTRGRSPREDFDYKAHRVGTWRVPLFVLIDGDSASASEIFAGAVRDHGRGLVIGERSYGKGSVQGIFPLGVAKSGVRLTTAKFYTPAGIAISNRGVEPNLTVHSAAKPIDGQVAPPADDAIMNAGLQAARGQLSQR